MGFLPLAACKRAWIQGARSEGDERHIIQYVKEIEQAQRSKAPYYAPAV